MPDATKASATGAFFVVKIYAELARNRKMQGIKSPCGNSILTGEYADTSKNGGRQGRQDWWIYIEGESGQTGGRESNHYKTREEAEQMAAYIKAKYNKNAVITKGRRPNYTLENAFANTMPKMIENLKKRLGDLE